MTASKKEVLFVYTTLELKNRLRAACARQNAKAPANPMSLSSFLRDLIDKALPKGSRKPKPRFKARRKTARAAQAPTTAVLVTEALKGE